jgi:S-adenosylmethionine:tRNA ribosyltransferase-isomerase
MIEKKKKYKLSDFRYQLPKKYIAQKPKQKRDASKMMVLNRKDQSIKHKKFSDITDYFQKNDLLILNNTKVFPAKLFATKDRTDAKVEIFLLRELGDRLWEVLVKPARKVRIGNKLILSDGLFCDVIDNTVSGGRVVRFEFENGDFDNILDKLGHPPLPPYIERPATKSDKERYQTVYAEKRGAVAAPIAGLHFTTEIIKKLEKKGVNIHFITLHIGLGTFKPVQVEDLNRHHMDSEYFEVSPGTALAINEAKRKRRRIFAVGTSTVRALETVNVSGFQISPKKGWTNKFIHPPHEFKIVDGLITNFHQPESTLLMLTSAFGGYKFIKDSYNEAKKKKYRFLSYGDSMLIM